MYVDEEDIIEKDLNTHSLMIWERVSLFTLVKDRWQYITPGVT